MKKLIMAVATVVGLGLGFVHAEEIDFDGKKTNALRTVSFDTANSSYMRKEEIAIPQPGKPEVVTVSGDAIASSGINKEYLTIKLDWSIKTGIEYCEIHKQFVLKNELIRLLQNGTFAEKYEFVYTTGRKSRRLNCLASHKEEVCIDREVCKNVCTAGGVVCYVASGGNTLCGPGAAVCSLVCTMVPKCTTVTVCDQLTQDDTYHGNGVHP
jgi:hypothetical protein